MSYLLHVKNTLVYFKIIYIYILHVYMYNMYECVCMYYDSLYIMHMHNDRFFDKKCQK